MGSHLHKRSRCEFSVWAPNHRELSLKIVWPREEIFPLNEDERGYWHLDLEEIYPGTRYLYQIDGRERPDPASKLQPEGVHGPSEVVDSEYPWEDSGWRGVRLEEMVIYEIHTGTFTPEGTFDSIIPRLRDLYDLGINAIEIMPVAQFPGERNWGYDGVFPFAVQSSYGGPKGLKRLVDACHSQGMAAILDVVYNHLGPEGNYLSEFGPYFTDRYNTPWGKALNFDDSYSDEVRNFFFQNARQWIVDFHMDALRLDAVHAIYDMSSKPFLKELSEKVKALDCEREAYLIAESDLDDVRVICSHDRGGFGLDAQWCDDFHHSLHALLTEEKEGYYADFGDAEDLRKAITEGFVYSWRYSAFRKKHHGSSSRCIPAEKFIVSSQNHDQIGNRMLGERLSTLIPFEALKLAAGATILSPYIPLLFMGEEYAEEAPFLYFVSHSDPELQASVRNGRISEFQGFAVQGDPPDPQDENTFLRSKLRWEKRGEGRHRAMLAFYKKLIELRRNTPALSRLSRENLEAYSPGNRIIVMKRSHEESRSISILNFSNWTEQFHIDPGSGTWKKALDSSETRWRGPGSSAPETIEQTEKFEIKPLTLILYLRA